ncbi:hypothetical protein D3C87_1175850 [compost metagenome]
MRLNAIGRQALDVLLDPFRAGRNGHLAIGAKALGRAHAGTGNVGLEHLLDGVHLVAVDRNRHLIGLGRELGKHVPCIVREPFGDIAIIFRGEGDRAADLDDHVRHGFAHAGDQLVEHGQTLGALAVQLAHMQVQHRGPGVVAVDGHLNVFFHGDWNFFREVRWNPGRCKRRGGNDQFLLVFGVHGSVKKVHVCLQSVVVFML